MLHLMGRLNMKYRIVLFGAGRFLDNIIDDECIKDSECLCICDNNPDIWNQDKYGLTIYNLSILKEYRYDFVVISNSHAHEIKKQLQEAGVLEECIKTYEEYVGICSKGRPLEYRSDEYNPCRVNYDGEYVLLITTYLSFAGGSWAAVYALMALVDAGYKVKLVTPGGDIRFVEVLNEFGVDVYVYPNVMFESIKEMPWLGNPSHVIVNTYQMHHCICNLKFDKKLIWWLHEAPVYYVDNIRMYGKCREEELSNSVIYGVSKYAEESFHQFYENIETEILEYGIPDERLQYKDNYAKSNSKKMIFGLVGTICQRKGHDLFADAIIDLTDELRERCEFWIIGGIGDKDFYEKVTEKCLSYNNIVFFPEMGHDELMRRYRDMDVLVCPSRQDPLPIVVTEAMMLGVPCILSDAVGTMRYVSDDDVICFYNENVRDLKEKIEFVIHNRNILDGYGKNVRKVYENMFSIQSFKDRLIDGLRKSDSK